ncbi:WD repeat-containing protein 82 [Phlyctochytrium bullatum]|nr:WD repeat-containing protein 82 [Phlyctochytrium bullatum]
MVLDTPAVEDLGQTLTDVRLESFKISKIFDEHESKKVNSLDFDNSGELCLSVGDNDSLVIYDCIKGEVKKTSYSKKYGCACGRFTHKSTNVLHASTKDDHAIRYLSFHDNKYIRYFKGHTDRVTCIEMAPNDDKFISAAKDGTVRLWDLRTPTEEGIIKGLQGKSCAAYDTSGLVFAVGTPARSEIRLYDSRYPGKGPFYVADPYKGSTRPYMPAGCALEWTSMRFSNCGKHLLLTTNAGSHLLLDAMELSRRATLAVLGGEDVAGLEMDACFTPDGGFVLGALGDECKISVWTSDGATPLKPLDGHRGVAPHLIAFNPRYHLIASAQQKVAFWTLPFE